MKILDPFKMILQFCYFLAEQKQNEGFKQVRVYADVKASLNGRKFQPFIDPDIDLATQERTLKSRSWVLPFEQ